MDTAWPANLPHPQRNHTRGHCPKPDWSMVKTVSTIRNEDIESSVAFGISLWDLLTLFKLH